MSGVLAIAGYGLQEAVRRRAFVVVLVLTAAFLALYRLGAGKAFEETTNLEAGVPAEVDAVTIAGATMFGLAMFATLFLGTVLAIFLTLGAVRGDAERGLLQPLVVRPVGRGALLLGRLLGTAAVCVPYVVAVYFLAAWLTWNAGGWWPDRAVAPGLELAGATVVIAGIALLGSVLLSTTANGIAVFMVFGAGLVAGLLGQIGEAIDSETLSSVARWSYWAVPFEALYQDALVRITAETGGIEGFVLHLGPFGGAEDAGTTLLAWSGAYLVLVLAAAWGLFSRKDL